MHDDFHWWMVPAITISAGIIAPVYATQYLTVKQAQKVLFPEANVFSSQPVQFTPEQKEVIEDYSNVRLRTGQQPVWLVEANGKHIGWFVVDEVYGKHEFITYAVALDVEGRVAGIEILDYRETHGGEIREPGWRAQFLGKKYGDILKLDEDIQNISGATYSCKHIIEGVRRILALYKIAIKGA